MAEQINRAWPKVEPRPLAKAMSDQQASDQEGAKRLKQCIEDVDTIQTQPLDSRHEEKTTPTSKEKLESEAEDRAEDNYIKAEDWHLPWPKVCYIRAERYLVVHMYCSRCAFS